QGAFRRGAEDQLAGLEQRGAGRSLRADARATLRLGAHYETPLPRPSPDDGVICSPYLAPSARRYASRVAVWPKTKRDRKRNMGLCTWPSSVMVSSVPSPSAASS